MSAKTPRIVFAQDYLAQTSGIGSHASPITLYTPDADGVFRVSVFVDAASGGGQVQVQLFWHDDVDNRELDFTAASSGIAQSITIIRATASSNISLAVTNGGDVFPSSYNVSVVIEEM